MNFIDRIITASSTSQRLDIFLDQEFENCTKFFEQSNLCLIEERWKIDDYIIEFSGVITKLNFTKKHISYCFLLFLDYLERYKLQQGYQELYSICKLKNLTLRLRHKASFIFLLEVNKVTDHYGKLDQILNILQNAYEEEEDSDKNVLVTFANYFSNVLLNAGEFHSGVLHNVVNSVKANEMEYSFIYNPFVEKILSLNFDNIGSANSLIQIEIENLFNLGKKIPLLNTSYFLESNTAYCLLLNNCLINFEDIRLISVNQLNQISFKQREALHNALLRGVKILEAEQELHAYMLFYGPMHYAKLKTAFHFLPKDIFEQIISIVDWGCGQGMASMALKEFLNINNIKTQISEITLIEPSEFALKRASLHVNKFYGNINITTIKKDLDSLTKSDFNNTQNIKIHLFSNILDIELFSLSSLLQLIKSTFYGINYFVCVSPYVNDNKTVRIDSFMKSFSKNIDYFEIIKIDNKKGEWEGTNWARVIRVFKAVV